MENLPIHYPSSADTKTEIQCVQLICFKMILQVNAKYVNKMKYFYFGDCNFLVII